MFNEALIYRGYLQLNWEDQAPRHGTSRTMLASGELQAFCPEIILRGTNKSTNQLQQ